MINKYFFIFFCLVFYNACVHSTKTPTLCRGIQTDYNNDIPAKILVLPCSLWPQKILHDSSFKTTALPKEITPMCNAFDEYIVDSFTDQPYINGFSPAAVKQMLAKKNQVHLLDQIKDLWSINYDKKSCPLCQDPAVFYKTILKNNTQWLLGLSNLAKASEYSDAILIPLIYSAQNLQFDDRGLLVSQRKLTTILFMVDVSNGALIWFNQRTATKSHKILKEKEISYPDFPAWQLVYDQAFVKSFWQKFPGMKQPY